MAGQTTITKYMDAIAAIAAAFDGSGVTGTSVVTVKKGRVRYQDTDNFQALIKALNPVTASAPPVTMLQGFFSFWLKDFSYSEGEMQPATIIGEMAVYVPPNTSQDMNAAWDFMIQFCTNGIGAQVNYLTAAGFGGNNLPRPTIKCALHQIDDVGQGGVAVWDFGNYGAGGITLPDP